jgi:hypothetical protein
MSWSIATEPAVPATELDKAIGDMALGEGYTMSDDMLAQVQKAIAVAKQMLLLGFHSGAYGPDNDPAIFYRASASGHANPNAERLPGWSDDFVYVQLAQVRPPEPPVTGTHAPSVV